MSEVGKAGEIGGGGGADAAFVGMAIAWEHTGDGEFPYQATVNGLELVVRVNDFPAEPLYSLLVNGRVDQDLEDWPTTWVRPNTPPHLLRAAASAQIRRGRIDPIVVAAWASELCQLASSGPAATVVFALDVPGTLDGRNGHWLLAPPPPGTTRFSVSERDGDVFTVEVTLVPPGPSRADLTAILGPGRDVVRIHYDQPHPVCYEVRVDDAPYTCDVFAYFPTQPELQASAERLMFRRQQASG